MRLACSLSSQPGICPARGKGGSRGSRRLPPRLGGWGVTHPNRHSTTAGIGEYGLPASERIPGRRMTAAACAAPRSYAPPFLPPLMPTRAGTPGLVVALRRDDVLVGSFSLPEYRAGRWKWSDQRAGPLTTSAYLVAALKAQSIAHGLEGPVAGRPCRQFEHSSPPRRER